ncbi:protein yellow-related [Holotrichia oblita]|uniref:Protein yellow-related n=1 Tax=Holotrichia oblita TaxID=644536 RepID=A0ACB9TUT3_HOLOL|nr:protein yellow-related [Holotrichia oblita]
MPTKAIPTRPSKKRSNLTLLRIYLISVGKAIPTENYFEFPIYLRAGAFSSSGFLNDLVIDEADGGYAYITENSDYDPGLIVYSRFQNRAWKLRDRSMFAELGASNFAVSGIKNNRLINVDGIAISPLPKRKNQDRLVYYCPISSTNLFAISNSILKHERLSHTDRWRKYIRYIGRKQGQSDGLIIDNVGNFYYGLLNLYAIGKWSIYEPFITSTIIDQSKEIFQWPDSFGFDSKGYLYVLCNNINKFLNGQVTITKEIKYKISRTFTGTNNYLHN